MVRVGAAYAGKLGRQARRRPGRLDEDDGGRTSRASPSASPAGAGRGAKRKTRKRTPRRKTPRRQDEADGRRREQAARLAAADHASRSKTEREEVHRGDSRPPTSAERRRPTTSCPSLDLLLDSEPFCFEEHEKEVRRKAKILEKTFADFGFNVRVVEIQTGPVIAQFEVELEAGLRLSKITGLADDLAIALRVPSVRIVAPIPGKNTVGIEVPNTERQLVRLREVIEETNGKAQKMRIPIFLGKDVSGNPMVVDLATPAAPADRRPHGHGQERLPELDHRLDADDPPARRGPHAADRPEDGRAEPLQAAAAPDAPGRHRHAQGRGDPGLGRREDGGAVSAAGPGRRAAHQRLQPAGRRGADGADPAGRRRGAAADPHAHALHRDRGRRDGRPDDDRRQGGRSSTSSAWPRRAGPSASTWSWPRRSRPST